MEKKKIIVGVFVIVILSTLLLIFYYKKEINVNKGDINEPGTTTFEKMSPLPPVDEAALQKKLQVIISKGNEGECKTLRDSRYQYACHDLFKVMKK